MISKEFKFDAAHNLVNYHGKCEKLHGHTYKLRVTLEGKPDDEGMIIDFAELKRIVNDLVISRLDHNYINEIITQPSAENIAMWIWKVLETPLKGPNYRLYSVDLWETESAFVTYKGQEE
ncbi:6-carboxy-5,6,7,8-tetrahydropterin synthase [Athalassotoga saccharophila]|nr:6-carboxytetrahydropterin synthase QueD [Athalassotoga saccharophila]BBJ27602.1 6-carboxy-5,6,7,8-tetrahydropterin synthase [Athalassotoga saccharophila]